jgi:hypothetical protein
MIADIVLKQGFHTIPIGVRSELISLENVDWGTARIRTETIAYWTAETSERVLATEFEPRNVLIIGHVLGNSVAEVEGLKTTLANAIREQRETQLCYRDHVLTFYPTKAVQFGITEQEDNEAFCKFSISGTGSRLRECSFRCHRQSVDKFLFIFSQRHEAHKGV